MLIKIALYLQQKRQQESQKLVFAGTHLLETLQHPSQELVSVQHAVLNTRKFTQILMS